MLTKINDTVEPIMSDRIYRLTRQCDAVFPLRRIHQCADGFPGKWDDLVAIRRIFYPRFEPCFHEKRDFAFGEFCLEPLQNRQCHDDIAEIIGKNDKYFSQINPRHYDFESGVVRFITSIGTR